MAQQRIVGIAVKRGKSPHRQPLNQHLHPDDLFINLRCQHHFGQQIAERIADGRGLAPARLDIFRKPRHVACLFARLVRRIFLRARVFQNVAERRRQGECARLAMQDRRDEPARAFIGKSNLLRVAHAVSDRQLQFDDLVERQHALLRHVEGRVIIDIALVERIPEMIMRRGNDLVESRRALAIALYFHHRGKIIRRHRVIGRIFGNIAHVSLLRPLRPQM